MCGKPVDFGKVCGYDDGIEAHSSNGFRIENRFSHT